MVEDWAKPKPTDGIVSRLINRRISTRITRLILRSGAPLTPNQVSIASFLLAIAAAYSYSKGLLVLGAILVQISSIVDGVDGELARARGQASAHGGFLDTMLDRVADIAIYVGLLVYSYNSSLGGLSSAALVVAAVTGDLMVSYLHAVGELRFGVHPALVGRIPPYASRDSRLFTIFLGTLLGQVNATLAVVASLAYSYVAAKSIELYWRAPGGGR